MTIYRSLLARGYFPKELPPAFFTEQFARYATSKPGRAQLKAYKPKDKFTECVKYSLALSGLDRRELRIPHPFSYSKIAAITSKHLSLLLKKASASGCSRSRPIYSQNSRRAIIPMVRPTNVAREKAAARAGSTFLLEADVSQFYPSLYTHAVGWAVNPELREKKNWGKATLLGKQLDQALMDIDGKFSQGIPIGPDVSFLIGEVVLGQVDGALQFQRGRAVRWYDDYHIAFDSRNDAEVALKRLGRELARYRLRLNPKKTLISDLPRAIQNGWQESLKDAGSGKLSTPNEMVGYFDVAFRLRERFPDSNVLLYALGLLFKVTKPSKETGRIAESCITQAVLCEPGSAQKAFALLSLWNLNGFVLDRGILSRTIEQMVTRHEPIGFSSDVAWALAFCLEQKLHLGEIAGKALSNLDDDCIAIQALHMRSIGLLPEGFSDKVIAKAVKGSDLDKDHWLLTYESLRQGFLNASAQIIASNPLFSDLLKRGVTFYRKSLPAHSLVTHHGSAPDWVIKGWIDEAAKGPDRVGQISRISKLIRKDIMRLRKSSSLEADGLLYLYEIEGADQESSGDEDYWS